MTRHIKTYLQRERHSSISPSGLSSTCLPYVNEFTSACVHVCECVCARASVYLCVHICQCVRVYMGEKGQGGLRLFDVIALE